MLNEYNTIYLVISKYKLKRCLKKECCKQCRQVKFMGTMTKNVQFTLIFQVCSKQILVILIVNSTKDMYFKLL